MTMAHSNSSSLAKLAAEVLADAQALDDAAAARGLPPPSLEQWTLSDLSLGEEERRKRVIDGCHKLKLLASGPVGQFYDVAFNVSNTSRGAANCSGGEPCHVTDPAICSSPIHSAKISQGLCLRAREASQKHIASA